MSKRSSETLLDKMVLHTTLYEIYKENWMHENVPPAERLDSFRRYKLINACQGLYNSYEDYLFDNGFACGSLYESFNDFMEHEYEDSEFIKSLICAADIELEIKEQVMAAYDFDNREAEYGSLPEDLDGYEYVKNEEFFNKEYAAENLYFLLYYNFYDSDIDHFIIRQAHVVDEWTHDECIENCLELLYHISNEEHVNEKDFLDSYNFPPEVLPAINEIKEALDRENEEEREI